MSCARRSNCGFVLALKSNRTEDGPATGGAIKMQHDSNGAASVTSVTGTRTLSRRQLLDCGLKAGALSLFAGAANAQHAVHDHAGMSHTADMSPTMGMVTETPVPAMDQPLLEPEVRRSVNGVLSTTLRVGYAYRQVGGVKLYVRSYEGGSPGPTLRMKPGETLRIKMINDVRPNRDTMPADISRPHQFNNTTPLFHGAHASPSSIADNVMRSMAPDYPYDIQTKLQDNH